MSANHSRQPLQTGEVFGYLTVLGDGRVKSGLAGHVCRCVCGKDVVVRSGALRNGNSKSCGCKRDELKGTHGQAGKGGTKTYIAWRSMITRCSPNHARYKARYFDRGIRVCERWLGEIGFANFFADMGTKPVGRTLDRRDNDKGYSPDNCRWATSKEQGRNRSTNTILEFNGESMSVVEWAERIGTSSAVILARLRRWTLHETLTRPVQKRGKRCG